MREPARSEAVRRLLLDTGLVAAPARDDPLEPIHRELEDYFAACKLAGGGGPAGDGPAPSREPAVDLLVRLERLGRPETARLVAGRWATHPDLCSIITEVARRGGKFAVLAAGMIADGVLASAYEHVCVPGEVSTAVLTEVLVAVRQWDDRKLRASALEALNPFARRLGVETLRDIAEDRRIDPEARVIVARRWATMESDSQDREVALEVLQDICAHGWLPDARLRSVRALADLGRSAEARAMLEVIVQEYFESPSLLVSASRVFHAIGDGDAARKLLERVCRVRSLTLEDALETATALVAMDMRSAAASLLSQGCAKFAQSSDPLL